MDEFFGIILRAGNGIFRVIELDDTETIMTLRLYEPPKNVVSETSDDPN